MSTTPYRADTDSILRDRHGQIVRAHATHPDWPAPIVLDLQDGSTLSWDEARAPRVTATLMCAIPTDQATFDALDPRTGVRVLIAAGYLRPGGIEDVHPVADLGLRRRSIDNPDDTMTLELAGDEALVIDASPSAVTTVTAPALTTAITTLIGSTINPRPVIEVTTGAGGYTAVTVNPITDIWETIRDLIDRADIQAYDAGRRAWLVQDRPTLAGESRAILKVGANGTVEASTSVLDRAGWWNYVLLRYKWRDPAGVDQLVNATAYVADGPYAITGPAGRRIYTEDREVPTTQADGNTAAAALLDRQVTRGRSRRLSAVSMWWLRPGMTITVQTPLESPERTLLASVEHQLTRGRMTITTRTPLADPYTTATTTPPSQPPAPDPTPPARQTYQTTWAATETAAYKNTGTKRTDTTSPHQGYYSATNGNQQGLALFTGANSTGGETDKTIAQAFTSTANLIRAEAWLLAEHWYYNNPAGGIGRIGFVALAALPATYTSANPALDVPGWQAGEGRWVDITSAVDPAALRAGQCAVSVGPGAGTDKRYYGNYTPAGPSNPPLFRLTYDK